MPTYAAMMDRGAAEYAEHLSALRATGLPADFTQTGGMCAALEVRLERGYLLITDAGDELPWARDYQRGWGVGYYKCDDVSDGPIEYVESPDQTDAEALLALVRDCLQAVASSN